MTSNLGSNTPINIVRATVNGLAQLKRADEVAALRGDSFWQLEKRKIPNGSRIKVKLSLPIGRIPSQRKTV